jgi:unsaturated rhamnogalacturonyl hydrolase
MIRHRGSSNFYRKVISSLIYSGALLIGLLFSQNIWGETFSDNYLFIEDFESGLSSWEILTKGVGSRVGITNSFSHSGDHALFLDRGPQGYAAISYTLSGFQEVRIQSWIYDNIDSNNSGTVEIHNSNKNDAYILLAIPPNNVLGNYYALRFDTNWITRATERSSGWHRFELVVTENGTMARVDGKVLEQPFPSDYMKLPWIHEEVTQARAIRFFSPWTEEKQIYDEVSVMAPPDSTDELILSVKDDFIEFYGETDFSALYSQLGEQDVIPCLPDMRSLAGTAMAFALDASTGGGDGGTIRVPKSLSRAKELISSTLAYGQWNYDDIDTEGLHYCNSLTTYELALSAWIIWDFLPVELKTAVKTRVISDANRYMNQPPHTGYIDDSKAEENAWTGKFLALAANMFPYEENSAKWDLAARCFAFHAITNAPTEYCGYTTQTVHYDFTIDNHSLSPNPLYADAVLQELSGGALTYRAVGKEVPLEFTHNVDKLWFRHRENIDWGRTYYYTINSEDWEGNQGWHWMGGTVAAFLSLEPATFVNGSPLISSMEELSFLQRRWLINDGRVAKLTDPVESITETHFSVGYPSYNWFLNANQVQDGYIWGYLYHHPEILEPIESTTFTFGLRLPAIMHNYAGTSSSIIEWQPALSPDGKLVAFVRQKSEQPGDIFLLDRDSNSVYNLTQTPNIGESTPVFSPDGNSIVFASNHENQWDIYTLDINSTPIIARRLITSPFSDELHPTFSPNGKSLAFSSNIENGDWDIYTSSIQSGDWTRLTIDSEPERFPSFSSDGSRIVYRKESLGNSDLYLMVLRTGEVRRISEDPAFDGYPSFTSDDSGIVFVSDRSGAWRVYDMNIGGAGLRSLTGEAYEQAHTPRLSSDGNTLVYAASEMGDLRVHTSTYRSPLKTLAARGITKTLGLCNWESGVFALGWGSAWQRTGDPYYIQSIKSWVDSCKISNRSITSVNDSLLGYGALMAYQYYSQPVYLNFAGQVADYLMYEAPRTSEGALTHIEDMVWVDTLVSVVPFLIEMSRVTGDPRYLGEAAFQIIQHSEILQDPNTGLYWHAWRESTGEYISKVYWARGNSWNMIASAKVLNALPITHTLRPRIIKIIKDQSNNLIEEQNPEGLWYTVVDRPDFYMESSGSAGIAYSLCEGVKNGWLSWSRVETSVERARLALWKKVLSNGKLMDVSAPTGPMSTAEDYNAISHYDLELYGQGMGLVFFVNCP